MMDFGADNRSTSCVPGWDALAMACKMDQMSVIQCLFNEKRVNIRQKDQGRKSLMHHAAEKEVTRTMTWLKKQGLDVNEADQTGSTPLQYAAKDKKDTAVQWLIRNGGNPRSRNNESKSPLDIANDELRADNDNDTKKKIVKLLS